MTTTGKKPDYVGMWNEGNFCELDKVPLSKDLTFNHFRIFITSSNTTRSLDKFRGRCEDRNGKSRIKGTLTENAIEFTKVYDINAAEGAARGTLRYRGVRVDYQGASVFSGIITRDEGNFKPKPFMMASVQKSS